MHGPDDVRGTSTAPQGSGSDAAGGAAVLHRRWQPPEKPSYQGEIVFLSVVLALTVFFAVAGIPGEAQPLAGNGSDRLKQGWLEEQLLTQQATGGATSRIVIRERSPSADELLRELEGTWLVETLQEGTNGAQQERRR